MIRTALSRMNATAIACILLFITQNASAQFGCVYNTTKGRWEDGNGNLCVNSIITAVPFLRIVPDARGGALGDAGVAISPDANSMHFNASKLAFVDKKFSASATYTPWLRALNISDVYMAYLTGYYNLDKLQTVGFGLRYFSLGQINFVNESNVPTGTGRPREFEITLAYARKLTDNFSVAISPKFIYSNLAAGQQVNNVVIKPGISGAADISMYYRTPLKAGDRKGNLAIGAAITNLGTKVTYTNSVNRDFIPSNLGLGVAYEMEFDEFNSLTFIADANKLLVPSPCLGENGECDEDGDGIIDTRQKGLFEGVFGSFSDAPNGFSEEMREISGSFGLEYWYDKQFAVRAGYYAEHYTKGNRKFLTVGLGLKYNVFGLNLSYLVPTTNQRNPLDNTLRFSLVWELADEVAP